MGSTVIIYIGICFYYWYCNAYCTSFPRVEKNINRYNPLFLKSYFASQFLSFLDLMLNPIPLSLIDNTIDRLSFLARH
jgi:hypothetical protein